MKKILSILSLCFCFMAAGVVLSACGNDGNKTISISADSSLVTTALYVNDTQLTPSSSGTYSVSHHANVTVKLSCATVGVDFSGITITINGKENEFFSATNYVASKAAATQYAGYFKLAYISENKEITISGLSKISSTFTIEKAEVDSEATDEEKALIETKLSAVSVSTSLSGDDFVSLSTALDDGGTLEYTRELDDVRNFNSNYRTFRVKFDNEYMFDLTQNSSIQVKNSAGTIVLNCQFYKNANDEYVVYLGNLDYQDNYIIVIDFSELEYKNYSFSIPQETTAYSVVVSSDEDGENAMTSRTYGAEAYVTITVKDTEACANMSVTLDGKAEGTGASSFFTQWGQNNNVYTYKISETYIPADGITQYIAIENVEAVYIYSLTFSDAAEAGATVTIYDSNELTNDNDVTTNRETQDGWTIYSTDYAVISWARETQSASEPEAGTEGFEIIGQEEQGGSATYSYYIYSGDVLLFDVDYILSEQTSSVTLISGIYTFAATYDETSTSFTKFSVTVACLADISLTLSSEAIS